MIVQIWYQEEVFLRRNTISAVEVAMMIGFLFIFMFNIISITWLFVRRRRLESHKTGYSAMLGLGVLCVFLLFANKVIVDEIGRESLLGWETLGEWLILYGMLTIQLAYNLTFIVQLLRSRFPEAPAMSLKKIAKRPFRKRGPFA
jgi:hypothetical protein